VNLEAMACETAVVATATGGIPEVVADGETGLLVPIDSWDGTTGGASRATDGTGTPNEPDRFVADLAAALNELLGDPDRTARLGKAGRRRAVEQFSWSRIAEQTMEVYRGLMNVNG
jgi:starch synthase